MWTGPALRCGTNVDRTRSKRRDQHGQIPRQIPRHVDVLARVSTGQSPGPPLADAANAGATETLGAGIPSSTQGVLEVDWREEEYERGGPCDRGRPTHA